MPVGQPTLPVDGSHSSPGSRKPFPQSDASVVVVVPPAGVDVVVVEAAGVVVVVLPPGRVDEVVVVAAIDVVVVEAPSVLVVVDAGDVVVVLPPGRVEDVVVAGTIDVVVVVGPSVLVVVLPPGEVEDVVVAGAMDVVVVVAPSVLVVVLAAGMVEEVVVVGPSVVVVDGVVVVVVEGSVVVVVGPCVDVVVLGLAVVDVVVVGACVVVVGWWVVVVVVGAIVVVVVGAGPQPALKMRTLQLACSVPAATNPFVTCAAQLTYAPWFRAGQHVARVAASASATPVPSQAAPALGVALAAMRDTVAVRTKTIRTTICSSSPSANRRGSGGWQSSLVEAVRAFPGDAPRHPCRGSTAPLSVERFCHSGRR